MKFTLTYKMRELVITYGITTDIGNRKYQVTLVK